MYKVTYEWWSDFHYCWVEDFLNNSGFGFTRNEAEDIARQMRVTSVCVTRNVRVVEV